MSLKRALLISAPVVFLAVQLIAGIGATYILIRLPIYPDSRFVSSSGLQLEVDSNCVPCQLGDVRLGTVTLFETYDSDLQIAQ
jgi:hypothetical protein